MKILDLAIQELEKLKIRDIRHYDLAGKSILADHFVLSTADSVVQLEGARGRLVELMWKHKIGLKNPMEDWEGGWLLMDFGNIILHVFLEETRSFYNLDAILENPSPDAEKVITLRQTSRSARRPE